MVSQCPYSCNDNSYRNPEPDPNSRMVLQYPYSSNINCKPESHVSQSHVMDNINTLQDLGFPMAEMNRPLHVLSLKTTWWGNFSIIIK